jgi:hypothetical protein
MKTVKIYKVSTATSSREIQARSRKEAIEIFKRQLKGYVSDTDKIKVQ